MVAIAVISTNTVLRPLAYRLHPVLPEVIPTVTAYEVNITCRSSDETHLRTLLLATISQAPLLLQAVHSEDIEHSDRMQIRADMSTSGQDNQVLEQIVARLSLEPGVSAASWSIVPTILE
jgi:putative Mg2+ transporter-C (MgtC) family protein